MSSQLSQAESGVLAWIDRDITGPMRDFQDPSQEWRRLFSELYGTFLLVIVAGGGGMMGQAFADTIRRTAAVVAPGLWRACGAARSPAPRLNPARTFGPDLGSGTFRDYWVYIAGPLTGALLAVCIAYVLRGAGGGGAGSAAGQGDLFTEVQRPDQI